MANRAGSISPALQLRTVGLQELAIHNVPHGLSVSNFNFDTKIETNVDNSQKTVVVSTTVNVNADDNKTKLGNISCACVFTVENFGEVVHLNDDNTFELAETLELIVNSISISTTRGLMASELRGTILHFVFLPIIDVKSLSKTGVR